MDQGGTTHYNVRPAPADVDTLCMFLLFLKISEWERLILVQGAKEFLLGAQSPNPGWTLKLHCVRLFNH